VNGRHVMTGEMDEVERTSPAFLESVIFSMMLYQPLAVVSTI